MPKFHMMLGLPASGKSTFAGHIDGVLHSSDAIRAELLGDENSQTNNALVFEEMFRRTKEDLLAGNDVVYDATNLSHKRRRHLLRQLRALDLDELETICVFAFAPFEDCVERDKTRQRSVGEDVLRRMYHSFDPPSYSEGWTHIVIAESGESRDLSEDLAKASFIEQDNPHHRFSVGQHMLAAYNYCLSHFPDAPKHISQAVLLHDIGKVKTKTFHNTHGEVTDTAHFYNHESVGAYDSFLYTQPFEKLEDRFHVALLIRWHMFPYVVKKSIVPDKTRDKFILRFGREFYEELLVINECDEHAH